MFDLSHEIRDFWMKKKPFFFTPTYKKWAKNFLKSAKNYCTNKKTSQMNCTILENLAPIVVHTQSCLKWRLWRSARWIFLLPSPLWHANRAELKRRKKSFFFKVDSHEEWSFSVIILTHSVLETSGRGKLRAGRTM